jgi:fluoride ion exporter CrcB/FEX
MGLGKILSARFLMATLTTFLACLLVGFIVFTMKDEIRKDVAVIIITGFMTTWASIVTFYFTRTDRQKGGNDEKKQ